MGETDTGETQDGDLTDINDRALFTAASCWTCFMTAVLGSEEALIAPLKESMIVVVGRGRALRLLVLYCKYRVLTSAFKTGCSRADYDTEPRMNLETAAPADFETWPDFLIFAARDCILNRFDILLTLHSLVDCYIRESCQPCEGKKQ